MPNYNFSNAFSMALLKFQQFACAMVSAREGVRFQRFGEGQDGGIDGLYIAEKRRTILQAKKIEVKGKALLRILTQERKRIPLGACDRYILVLSVDSIRETLKEEIRRIFPEIIDSNDIITGIDLNGWLEEPQYAHIERNYPELWFHSGNYLEELLAKSMSAAVLNRSRVKLKLIEKETQTFIETQVFAEAQNILEKHHRVIISGEPGAGKTTHALCLADLYIRQKGYEKLYFAESLREIEQILGDEPGRCMIIFDDFWGHSSISESRLELNEERKLADLFRILPCYPEVRLVFTTREFVLQQGFCHFPELEKICELKKVTLQLSAYSLAQKAEILFRHLYVSNLGYLHTRAIFEKQEDIIYCEAYSPRSVAYYLENVSAHGKAPEEYAEELLRYVRAPEQYFESIFSKLSYGARLICMLLLVSEEEIRIVPELRREFMVLADVCKEKVEKEQFEKYLQELEGCFTEVKESMEEEVIVLDFLNHSIRDFMKKYLDKHIETFEMILAENCIYFNQLIYLSSETEISQKCRTILFQRLVNEMQDMKYSFVFNMDINWYYSADAFSWEYGEHKILQLCVQYQKYGDNTLYQFLKEYCDKLLKDLEEGRVDREQLESIADILPRMMKSGYPMEGRQLLDMYYKNIQWVSELKFIEALRPCCPEYFDEFMRSILKKSADGFQDLF